MALGWLTAETFRTKTCFTVLYTVLGLTFGMLGPLGVAGAADFYEPPPPPY
jgi:hypothetical protein